MFVSCFFSSEVFIFPEFYMFITLLAAVQPGNPAPRSDDLAPALLPRFASGLSLFAEDVFVELEAEADAQTVAENPAGEELGGEETMGRGKDDRAEV